MTVPDFSLHKHFFLNIKLTNPKFPTLKKKLPNQNETKKFFFSLISLTILAIPLEIEKYLTKGQNISAFFLVLCSKIEFSSG